MTLKMINARFAKNLVVLEMQTSLRNTFSREVMKHKFIFLNDAFIEKIKNIQSSSLNSLVNKTENLCNQLFLTKPHIILSHIY